jgi:membrane associated rhomboid family serine protease
MQQGPGPLGGSYRQVTIGLPTVTPAVRAILIASTAVWLIQWFCLRAFDFDLSIFLGLAPALVARGFLWQPVTYMFLHSPLVLSHILFNMLMLWMIGGDLERLWGSRGFLRYYLISGVGAGVFSLGLGWASGAPNTITVGASGAIFGLIVAFGMLFGERTILFMMLFPMRARTFAWIMFAIAFFSTWNPQSGGVAHVAHLGGAVTGFLYLKRAWRPLPLVSELRWRLRRRRFRVLGRRHDDYPFH